MSARAKINGMMFSRAVFLAALVGLAFQSWIMFLLVAAGLIAAALRWGAIRLGSRRR